MVDIRVLTSPDDLDAAFVLRHRICVEELGWVPAQPGGRERDEWDDGALHVGAFADADLVGYVRVAPDSVGRGTMTHRYFAGMFRVTDPRPPIATTGDLSRLVIAAGHREPHLGRQLSVSLVDHAQHRSQDAGLRFWYLVTGDAQLGLLHHHYADVRILGRGTTSDGGTNSVVLVDLESRTATAAERPAC